jgi:hypothetical protein
MIEYERPIVRPRYLQYHHLSQQKLMKLYLELLKDYRAAISAHSRALYRAASMEYILSSEQRAKLHFKKQYEKLYNMHRTLPPGCFKVPDYRPPEQPLRIGDKGKEKKKEYDFMEPVDEDRYEEIDPQLYDSSSLE